MPSIPLGTDVGLLLVPKGCGVQVGGGLMDVGPYSSGCPNWLKVVGLSGGLGSGSLGTSARAIPQAGSPTGLTLAGCLSPQDYPGIKVFLIIKLRRMESLRATHLGTIMVCLGGGGGLRTMADADLCADEYFPGG